jgi:hypothetical protein
VYLLHSEVHLNGDTFELSVIISDVLGSVLMCTQSNLSVLWPRRGQLCVSETENLDPVINRLYSHGAFK